MRAIFTLVLFSAVAAGGALGCRSKAKPKPESEAAPAASARPILKSLEPKPPPSSKHWAPPSGPMLAVLAGKGVGPIRLGATTKTIERLMELPCEVKSETVCRYLARGVEFSLDQGVTKSIHVHRAGRPAGKDASGKELEYGFFRGAIPPDLQLGMIPSAIQEHLGPPKKVDRREVAGPALNVEVHHYDGLLVEYDRIENGNLVMGGIVVEKSDTPASMP